MMKEIQLPSYYIKFKASHAILVMKEGSTVTMEISEEITSMMEDFYKGKNFILISHRRFPHDIDLNVYKGRILKNMIGYAIVSDNPEEMERAMVEQSLWNEAFTFFKTLEEAENWASSFFD
ncbi:hypothetical protein [Aquimarina algicola]|uniref:STAS/SEC14 domain-containing protein n=1 Tax=Aquimarina algicola TaxID=2589995 RepID=A0A504JLB2_9FLAO|nr:hypothetical protein [Aquimarina algicola]TPN87290.1 hypothetical protein FHK87_06805 [Aquimarina algicola]